MGIAEQSAQIARTLNQVKTLGQARGAVRAAIESIDRTTDDIKPWFPAERAALDGVIGGPATVTAIMEELRILRVALNSELKTIQGADDAPVSASWTRTRRQVDRAYVAIAGAEGATSARPDLMWHLDNLTESVKDVVDAAKPFFLSGAVIAVAVVVFFLFVKGR